MMIFRGVYGRAAIIGLLLGGATGQLGTMFGLPIMYPLLVNGIIAILVGYKLAQIQRRPR